MNFLAHAWLARADDEWVMGGIIADFIKGRLTDQFSHGIMHGIRLHREIDKFCDHHPGTQQFRETLPQGTRRFAGIILDITYDHLLAREWNNLCEVPLQQFASDVYQIITHYHSAMPEHVKPVLDRMRERDWLNNYQHLETLKRAMKYTASRLRRGDRLSDYADRIENELCTIEPLFDAVWPDIVEHVSPEATARQA